MTIYDQDYMAELDAQNQAMAVQDSFAKNQDAASQQAVDHKGDNANMIEDTSSEHAVEHLPDAADKVNNSSISDKEYNFKALRDELAAIKQQSERDRHELEDIRRSQVVRREPEAPRKRAIDDINSDDLVTGAQFKQAMAEREAEYQLMLGELQVKSKYSDYDEVTSKYGVPLIETEPDLAQGFLSASNKAAYLYKIGKMAMNAERGTMIQQPVQEAPQASQNAQRIVENSKKPGTLSNAVGGSGNLSKADYYASMSEAEFQAFVSKNMQEI